MLSITTDTPHIVMIKQNNPCQKFFAYSSSFSYKRNIINPITRFMMVIVWC